MGLAQSSPPPVSDFCHQGTFHALPLFVSFFKMDYHDRVKFWIVVVPLWLIALAALVGIVIRPGNLDIYYHDTYMVVAKIHVMLAILLLFVLPLLVLTIWHFRSTNI